MSVFSRGWKFLLSKFGAMPNRLYTNLYIISMQFQITFLDIVFLNWNQNFREGRCRYSGSLLEHLDHIASPENCQHACKLLKPCKYFNYDKTLKDCELLGSANRNCDLIRGPRHPSFDVCWENENILWRY